MQQQQPEQPRRKRQQQQQQDGGAQLAREHKRPRAQPAPSGPPPTLAQLAAQLDAPAPQQQQLVPAGGEQALAVQAQQQGGKLQRFSLFAEEEALAAKRKNPEAEVGVAAGALPLRRLRLCCL